MYPDTKDEVVQLYLDDIIPNRFQPREVFDEKALKELAVSIKEHGVIQPIIVRNVNGKYEIIAGERRYKASALAGMTKIPAIVRDLDDKESSKVALLENLQRKNLNPIEEARTYQKILEIDEMTQEELAKTMGKSQSAVANKIRLLSLPDDIQDSLLKEQISERHARTLLNIPDAKKQKEMLKKIIDTKMSVRALEEEIKTMYPKEEAPSTDKELPTTDTVASSIAFVNNDPLIPTAALPEDTTSNYGKVTIAPPIGSDMPTNKFINYGEIDDEDNDDDTDDLPVSPVSSININDIKANTSDINNAPAGSAALDNLLNISSQASGSAPGNFITPAEKIVKTDPLQLPKKEEDYFKTSELNPLPSIPNSTNKDIFSFGGGTVSESSGKDYTIEEATEKIRNLVVDLKDHGIKINSDEMDFEKSYQIIIKIEKE